MASEKGIPKMTMDCKEIFSIFMKSGGMFTSDFESNKCTLYPSNVITGGNLHEIHEELHNFEDAHRHYPLHDKIIKINYLRPDKTNPPTIVYDKTRDIRNMLFYIEFDKFGGY